jgi:arylsulfatase A-like enzyme
MDRPNILWICTDQQRWDTIAALGHPGAVTPTLDRLVGSGVAFDRCYVQAPICTPSRGSFLTGLYPSACRIARNGVPDVPAGTTLVTKMLADAGYRCGLVGKLHLTSAFQRIETRCDDGYETFHYSHAPRDNWPAGHDYADWVRAKGHSLAELVKDPAGVPAELHQTTWAAERSIQFIEAADDRPWLLSINPYDPHPPFNPPASYRKQFDPAVMPNPLFRPSDLAQQEKLAPLDFQSRGRDPKQLDITHPVLPAAPGHGLDEGSPSAGERDAWTLRAAYFAMIRLLDDQIGRILDALESSGQLDRTVVLFTSDHGEMLGDHGLIEKGCRFYEGLVHVPMLWSLPGRFLRNRRSEALVMALDIAPTLLDIAGLEIPAAMQGRSLLPLLEGRAPLDRHHHAVRCEYLESLDKPANTRGTMLFDGRYKLCLYHTHHLGELYDLAQDPGEFEDLWDSPAHQGLKALLMQRSFDATVQALDLGSPRIGPM